jgi:signal transduction histidine kinase/ligand-binding sensor domain-containing protein/AraC-like DNA-binding protein
MSTQLRVLIILALSVTGIFTVPLLSQQVTRFGISDGLSSDEVTSVCRNDNYYWIGTTDGLSRFDGSNFKVYKRGNDLTNGISSNNIEVLMMDSDNRMWIGYKTTGADLYYPKEDKFIPLSKIVDKPLPHRVISIYEDSEHNIWLGSWEEGIFQLIPESGNKKYRVLRHYQESIVSSFLEKPKGSLWIGTYYGGLRYTFKSNQWDSFGNEQTITSLVNGGENEILYSTWNNGIKKITFSDSDDSVSEVIEKDFYNYPLTISKMLKLPDQSLALGSWGEGLCYLRNDKNRIVRNDMSNSENNVTGYINNLYLDDSGILWVGTYGNGLFRSSIEKPVIKQLNFNSVIKTPVSTIYKLTANNILLGTRGEGCFVYDMTTGNMTPIVYNSGNISGSYLLSAMKADNLLLLGSDDMGLAWNQLTDEKLLVSRNNEMILNGNQFGKISAISKQENLFYFGTKQNGFFTADFNSKTRQFENLKQNNLIGRDEITGFAKFSDNKVWISTHNGLFLYNYLSDTLENYSSKGIKEAVYCLKNDTLRNRVWIGTSSGTYYIDRDLKEIKHIVTNKILPAGSVKTLLIDRKSNLWFTITNRLFLYQVDKSGLLEIDISKVVRTPVISSEILISNQKESLLLGSSEGVTLVDIEGVYNTSDNRKVILTDIDIDLQRIHVGDTIYNSVPLKESTEYLSDLKLSYKCKWISFYFSETGANILRSHYQYRISGFSSLWENFETITPITISQLPPGDYVLEVRKYTGELSQEIIWRMNLKILPPFWHTLWFRIVEFILVLAIAFTIILIIQKRYKKRMSSRLNAARKEQELDLLKEKESFFMGLSHDILTPFTLILSPARDLIKDRTILSTNRKKVEVILKNANFLSDMFSTILDFKQAENSNDNLNIRDFELINFSKILLNSFQYLADSRKIILSFESNVATLNVRSDNVKYERVLYNLLSNSLKYSPENGKITLTINLNAGHIEILIEDNGYGIDAKNRDRIFEKFYREKSAVDSGNKGLGLGLYIVKKFVTLLGGKIELNANKGTGSGTVFLITLPGSIIIQQSDKIYPVIDTVNQSGISSADLKPALVLVEDNDDMRNYMIEKLSVCFNVCGVSNGVEAIKCTKELLPEIIISDLIMPGMDGLTLCQKIKEDESLSDIFFILITAKNSPDTEISSYKEGVDIFIKKPFDIDVLIKQISNILSTRLKQKNQIIHRFLVHPDDSPKLGSKDIFVKNVMRIVEEKLADSDFKLEDFAGEMNLSLTVLHRKFRVLLGETPNQFIRTVRLKKAGQLLLTSDLTIAEVGYMTGFKQPHYFIKCFKDTFKETPKNYRLKANQVKNNTNTPIKIKN